MSTSLEKVQSALSVDLVVAATEKIATLDLYDPESMDESDEVSLVDTGAVVTQAIKRLEDQQAELVRPLNDHVALIRSKFAPTLNALKAAKAKIGGPGGLLNQLREVKRARAEADRVAQASAAAAAAAASREDDGPEIPAAETVVPEVRNTVKGGIGKVTGRRTPKAKLAKVTWVAANLPHVLELNSAAALSEYRAVLARHRGDEKAAIAWMAERGIEVYHVESSSFGTV